MEKCSVCYFNKNPKYLEKVYLMKTQCNFSLGGKNKHPSLTSLISFAFHGFL